jgi:small-conductance mechanosensitive channel
MKFHVKRVLAFVMMMVLIMMSSRVSAQEHSQGEQAPAINAETPDALPQLAEIIPLAAELTVRLSSLESKIADSPDLSSVEREYVDIQKRLEKHFGLFQRVKTSEVPRYNRLEELEQTIRQEKRLFDEISAPIDLAIRRLGEWREGWLEEKQRWREWEDLFIKEKELDQLRPIFDKAYDTIDTALNLVVPQLDATLKIQEKGADIDARLKILSGELDRLILEERRGTLHKGFPPMFSPQFWYQFGNLKFWAGLRKGIYEISEQGKRLIALQGWVVLLQGLVSLVVIIALYRNRALLKESKRWCFLSKRPISAGLFLGYMATALIYEYQGVPTICKQTLSIVGGIAFARLVGGLLEISWKRQFVYGLMAVLVVTSVIEMIRVPLPVFRLYTVAAAMVAFIFCLRWARASVRRKESRLYNVSLRFGSVFFAVIVLAELWGKEPLPSYLLISSMRSMAAVLLFMLLIHMIRGGVEWLFRLSPLRRMSSLYGDTDALAHRVGRLIELAVWGLVLLPAILVLWGVYDDLASAATGLLALGFNLGSQRISVGLLIVAAGLVYGSFLVSWILQNLLLDKVLHRRGVEKGVRVSIKRLIHYVLISIGFLLAISSLGLELTKLTIIISALGVGIGFGLQGVVNNFVSGLILLFEQPVRVGDYIELNGNWCEIQKIGLRATSVQTFDQSDVIIPNADLVNNQVTNWTLRNRRARIIIPVGVAYGSDIALVIETLKASADPHPMVAKDPQPQVLFLSFGESSLDFELRVWVLDVDQRLTTRSELHQEIDRRFREAKIEIAFPQRDLHFRSMDASFPSRPPDTT